MVQAAATLANGRPNAYNINHMPNWPTNLLIAVSAFAGMEAFAWAVHRYVMHSRWGWGWHESHHTHHDDVLEKNDLFAVVFAAPAILLFVLGSIPGWRAVWWAGAGVTAYGVMYALVHDGLVHGRFPFRLAPRSGYAKRLVQAHRLHHATHGRDGAVSFGFLYAPDVRKLKARLRAQGVRGSVHGVAHGSDRGRMPEGVPVGAQQDGSS